MSGGEGIKFYPSIPGGIFTEELINVISTMTGFNVTPDVSYIEKSEEDQDIIGTIILFGEKKLLLTLTANKNTASLLVTYMTGMAIDELTEPLLCDGITEFINIVSGLARAALENSNYRFTLSVPFAITGKDIKVIVKNRTERYFTSFNTHEFQLYFKIFEI